MERHIEDLPEQQREFVSTLVENRGQELNPEAFLIDMPLAKTPGGRKILTVTYVEGHGRVKTIKVAKASQTLPVMDKQRMGQLVR